MAVSETSEQMCLVRELRRAGVLFTAVPNGGLRVGRNGQGGGGSLKAQGVRDGVPDILIFDRPPSAPPGVDYRVQWAHDGQMAVRSSRTVWPCGPVGVALEMKRDGARVLKRDGTHNTSVVSDEQWAMLDALASRGWVDVIGCGWRDAVAKLRYMGFDL